MNSGASPRSLGKASVKAPANIAFIKYWGARDLERALPVNASISMTLSVCQSHSTVEALEEPGNDAIWWADESGRLVPAGAAFTGRALAHLDRLRRATGFAGSFRVATRNSFPASAGIASSASGFAALTLAVVESLGLEPSPAELSRLARASGSASAARSVLGGYVELPAGLSEEAATARCLAPAQHWPLADVIVLVDDGPKDVSSLEGHRRALTSPYFEARCRELPDRLAAVREAIADRDLESLGPLVEEEAIDLHLIAMSSKPPIFYWRPATLEVLAEIRRLRNEGISVWATMDAGPNVHALCKPEQSQLIGSRLRHAQGVSGIIYDQVGPGPESSVPPLF